MEKQALSPELVGERIVLRKHRFEDAETMYRAVERDRRRLAEFLPWVDFIQSRLDEEKYVLQAQENWESGVGFDYSIFLRGSETYVGNVGYHTIFWSHETAEIGYWILDEHEGTAT